MIKRSHYTLETPQIQEMLQSFHYSTETLPTLRDGTKHPLHLQNSPKSKRCYKASITPLRLPQLQEMIQSIHYTTEISPNNTEHINICQKSNLLTQSYSQKENLLMKCSKNGDIVSYFFSRNDKSKLPSLETSLDSLVWFLCFNGISTFVGYLMPKPFSYKNSSGTI